MKSPDTHTTVGELVSKRPSRSRVFDRLGIDYCCGGKTPLAEACRRKGLDADDVLRQLREADAPNAGFVDADAMGLSELADHIVATHHAYLRAELPRLEFMTRKVAAVHGEGEPRLHDIRQTFVAFQRDLLEHMLKEERVLFPMIRQIEAADGPIELHCGSLANPIRMMEHEHDAAGDALTRFDELTDGYTPPEWACNTFRALYDALAELEANMHQHVHKENNVLFPKALGRETALARSASPATNESLVSERDADFTRPIELMMDCHRRIKHFFAVVADLNARYADSELDEEGRRSLETALNYFRSACPRHTADEEVSLFPRMRRCNRPDVQQAMVEIDRLEADHRKAEAAHARLDELGWRWLRDGRLDLADRAELTALIGELGRAYEQHIRLEDERIFVLAAEALDAESLLEVGREMRQRRIDDPGRAGSRCAANRRQRLQTKITNHDA